MRQINVDDLFGSHGVLGWGFTGQGAFCLSLSSYHDIPHSVNLLVLRIGNLNQIHPMNASSLPFIVQSNTHWRSMDEHLTYSLLRRKPCPEYLDHISQLNNTNKSFPHRPTSESNLLQPPPLLIPSPLGETLLQPSSRRALTIPHQDLLS